MMGIACILLPSMIYSIGIEKRAGGAGVEFRPFVVLAATGEEMPVQIVPAQDDDLQVTCGIPAWQTDWTSEFLSEPTV